MNITFGIITTEGSERKISIILSSIAANEIPPENFEILIIGNVPKPEPSVFEPYIPSENIKIIPFNENIKDKWITKKKNLITDNAKYENVVYMHDYIIFHPEWYKNLNNYKNPWKIMMNQILNADNTRFRDWVLWTEGNDDNPYCKDWKKILLPYETKNLSKFMYISGAFWLAKKSVMEEFPLNEDLCWGDGEDVEWSLRVREKYDFSINEKCIVKTLKQKYCDSLLANLELINEKANSV
tara:strand:+ start:10 stop:729 length:720 start_codon:yes stop_codon:yes gene_type:complete